MPSFEDARNRETLGARGDWRLSQPLMFAASSESLGATGWIAENLWGALLFVLSFSVVTLLAATIYAIVRELRHNKVMLEPIPVPPQLAATGYTPEVLAQRLLDALLVMQQAAPPLNDLRGVDEGAALVDFDPPGKVSLRSLVRRLRRLLLVPGASIGGEVTQRGTYYELLLRVRDRRTVYQIGAHRGSDVAALLQAGAEDILRCIDPWILAHHHFAQEDKARPPLFTRTIATLQLLLERAGRRERPWVLNMLGICQLRRGLPTEAATTFGEAAAAGPNLPFIHQNWAEALLQLGRLDEAQAHRKRALEIPARTANLLANNAILAAWLHRPGQAVALARKALAKAPDNGRAWAAWGYALFGMHRLDQAAAACERAAALGVHDVFRSVPQALVYAALGQGDKAVACANDAIASDGESREALKAMGFAQLAAGDPVAALRCFDWVLARSPFAGDAAFGKGDALFALGRPETAADQYSQAIAIDPLFPQAWVGWGRALFVLGEADEAQRKFAEAVRLDPDYPRAWREWANALRALGRTEEAQTMARRAAEVEQRTREPLPVGRKVA